MRYSYWSAARTFRRPARRAGRIAASVPAPIAMAVNTAIDVSGSENATP